MELYSNSKDAFKKTIYPLALEKQSCDGIKISENNEIYKKWLLELTDLSNELINIICQYICGTFELSICCALTNYRYDVYIKRNKLDFEVSIMIKNLNTPKIRLCCEFTNNLKYSIFFDSISHSVLNCFYSCDTKTLLNKFNNNSPSNFMICCFELQYFFNAYMKRQYGYNNYMQFEIHSSNHCKHTINGYLHTQYNTYKNDYYLLCPVDHEIIETIIKISKTIINELNKILTEIYSKR